MSNTHWIYLSYDFYANSVLHSLVYNLMRLGTKKLIYKFGFVEFNFDGSSVST